MIQYECTLSKPATKRNLITTVDVAITVFLHV